MYLITSKQGKTTPKTATAVFQYISNENQHFRTLKKPLKKGLSACQKSPVKSWTFFDR
jgi:hypothetical protein